MVNAPMGALLRQGEEEWQPAFVTLSGRFPTCSGEAIAHALRANNGHAGIAAKDLRDLTTGVGVKEVDPEDAEHVATLLSSPTMFKHACKTQFRKFDKNGDGVLDWPEVVALASELYRSFGLPSLSESSLRAVFDANDENRDGVLSENEFTNFFERFLRQSYFGSGSSQLLVGKQQQAQRPQEISLRSPCSGITAALLDSVDCALSGKLSPGNAMLLNADLLNVGRPHRRRPTSVPRPAAW